MEVGVELTISASNWFTQQPMETQVNKVQFWQV